MCFIDFTNYQQCADPRGHNGPCEVDRRRFAPFLRTFHYTSQVPGFIPCGYVLTGQLPPDQCSTQTRLSEAQACPRCNGTFREHNHLVTYQQGLVAAVGPLDPDHPENGHAFHLPAAEIIDCLQDRATTIRVMMLDTMLLTDHPTNILVVGILVGNVRISS
ncbi:hypothetical protein EG327_005596 [Venturia inaequalis]|uniref:Uncharacterized protein n=1 Tax=Venturia inaequalis TaxID=5025 RepID=A0A8H3V8I9_VENIN|nr:hypothetical protein EG327_005596 [Venturia inaequalis]